MHLTEDEKAARSGLGRVAVSEHARRTHRARHRVLDRRHEIGKILEDRSQARHADPALSGTARPRGVPEMRIPNP